ncbi:hypothetical protein HYT52_01360 [Candidatus Woesearchaeota archaeon]|nr:hypothetical protein [Candidatus Woesearchaeota archaeon]
METDDFILSEKTKKGIEQARAEIRDGKFYTHEQVKKKIFWKENSLSN